MKKTKPLCGKPQSGFFCGPDKYLVLQKHRISEQMFPVVEMDSYFILVRKGEGTFLINGEEFPVVPGCISWIQASQVLTIIPNFGAVFDLWVVTYDYQLLSYWLFNQVTVTQENAVVMSIPVIGPDSQNAARIAELFRQFETLSRHGGGGSAVIRSSFLRKIELLYNRDSAMLSQTSRDKNVPLGRRTSLYMATHSSENLTPALVAEALGRAIGGTVSEAQMNHALRISTGMSFNQYLCRLRIVHAVTYFLYSSLPFDYIAAAAGFNRDISFYRCFKKYTGMTPQRYREQMISSGGDGRVYRGMIMSETIISAINYIYEHFSERLDMDILARKLFTSGSILRIQFRDYFECSFKEILTLFRVRYAETLLSTTDLPIIDISIESGFSSDRTMGRVFYEINGMSPGQFRRKRMKGGKEIGGKEKQG